MSKGQDVSCKSESSAPCACSHENGNNLYVCGVQQEEWKTKDRALRNRGHEEKKRGRWETLELEREQGNKENIMQKIGKDEKFPRSSR